MMNTNFKTKKMQIKKDNKTAAQMTSLNCSQILVLTTRLPIGLSKNRKIWTA